MVAIRLAAAGTPGGTAEVQEGESGKLLKRWPAPGTAHLPDPVVGAGDPGAENKVFFSYRRAEKADYCHPLLYVGYSCIWGSDEWVLILTASFRLCSKTACFQCMVRLLHDVVSFPA